jgi:AraC-like DNA-binding protein
MKDTSGDVARWVRSLEAADPPLLATQYRWTASSGGHGHQHSRGQLAFSGEGVITVSTAGGRWVTPPNRAVWIPPRVFHETSAAVDIHLHSVFVREDLARTLPQAVTAVAVSPLLRELILHAAQFAGAATVGPAEQRVLDVILDQLRLVRMAPLDLPMPRDKRLLKICEAILRDPAARVSLQEWERTVGASRRTITRLFPAETQLTFDGWRKQALLLEALRRLADGQPVSQVALELNYDSSSAFIAMFKKSLGATPGKYFSQPG